jgi:LysM repeat protein
VTKTDRVRIHAVRPGETLTHLARRYQTTVCALMRTNRLDSVRIQAGAALVIPPGEDVRSGVDLPDRTRAKE